MQAGIKEVDRQKRPRIIKTEMGVVYERVKRVTVKKNNESDLRINKSDNRSGLSQTAI